MKKILLLSFTLLISMNIFSQSIESITKRVSDEICDCVGEIKDKAELKKKLKECSDEKINFIMNNSTKEENKVLLKGDNLKKVINRIEPYVLSHCENVKRIIANDLNNEVDKVSENKEISPFPTNFNEKDLKRALKNSKNYVGKIISFDAEIVRVENSRNDTPYYEAKIGKKTIWIISMMNSDFLKVGNTVRVVGYFMLIDKEKDKYELKFHNKKFHILSFGVIDIKSKKLSYFPGSQNQMKEWMNGKIPSGGK